MSKTITFKVKSHHAVGYLDQKVEEITSALALEDIDKVNIEMDFRVRAYGGMPCNDEGYYGVLVNKEFPGYPINTHQGQRNLYDGDMAINKILEAIAASKIASVNFSNSCFYPGSLEALLKLKGNPEIKHIDFNKCVFYNADSQFFKNNFANTDITLNLDEVIIVQKGKDLGVAEARGDEELFATLEIDVETVEALGEGGVDYTINDTPI